MKCVHFLQPNLLHFGALHYAGDYLATLNNCKQTVEKDLRDSNLQLDDLKSNIVLLDFRGEGQDNNDISNLIAYLRSVPVKDVAVIFGTKVDVSQLDYPAVSVVDSMANHCGWFDNLQQHRVSWDTNCNFLCLLRRPSVSRALLANRLLSEITSLRLSFGSMSYAEELTEYQAMIPGHSLPILLDGRISRDQNNLEHDVSNLLFRACAVNIIAESSSQHDSNSCHSIFVTEKTFKAFGMLQLPLWWAVPGTVDCVRNMGFDMFDDVIDHSYDNEHNQDARLNLLMQQVHRLNSMNLVELRDTLRPRLANNWKKLDQIVQNQSGQLKSILKNLNLDMQV